MRRRCAQARFWFSCRHDVICDDNHYVTFDNSRYRWTCSSSSYEFWQKKFMWNSNAQADAAIIRGALSTFSALKWLPHSGFGTILDPCQLNISTHASISTVHTTPLLPLASCSSLASPVSPPGEGITDSLELELLRNRSATKSDDALVPEYLWDCHIVSDLDPQRPLKLVALAGFRNFFLLLWQRRITS
jgi:hypothetical protein